MQYVAAPAAAAPAGLVQGEPGQAAPGQKKEKKEENKAGQPGPKVQLKSAEFAAPRLGVQVVPLGASDMLGLLANSPQDLEAALAIIQYVLENAKGANIEVRTVHLQWEDPQRVANKLHELYNRVNVVPGVNNLLPPRQMATQAVQTATGTLTIAPPAPQPLSLLLLPVPTQMAIMVAAPAVRIQDVIEQIEKLDVPHSAQTRLQPFQLKRASALTVSQQLQSFLPTRFPGDPATQIKVTYDMNTNTVFVQAAAADMEDIRELIERIDTTIAKSVNELRLFYLRYSLSDEVAAIIGRAISDGTLIGSATPGSFPAATGGGAVGGFGAGGGIGGGAGAIGGFGAGGGIGGAGAIGGIGGVGTAMTGKTKYTPLKFLGSPRPPLRRRSGTARRGRRGRRPRGRPSQLVSAAQHDPRLCPGADGEANRGADRVPRHAAAVPR